VKQTNKEQDFEVVYAVKQTNKVQDFEEGKLKSQM